MKKMIDFTILSDVDLKKKRKELEEQRKQYAEIGIENIFDNKSAIIIPLIAGKNSTYEIKGYDEIERESKCR